MVRRTWLRYVLLILWMAVIYRASATPNLKAVPLAQRFGVLPEVLGPWLADLLETLIRKGAHLVSFGILALLAYFALAGSFARRAARQLAWVAFGFAVVYAVADEFHQTFVPSRDGKLTDVLIDAAGAALALLLVRWRSR